MNLTIFMHTLFILFSPVVPSPVVLVWLEQTLSIKHPFKQVLNDFYKAVCHQVDFLNKAEEVRNLVNVWVETETRGLVKQILPPTSVDRETKLIMANAIYFKGAWSCEFDASRTMQFDFHLLKGYSVRVPFMTCRKKKQQINAFNGFKVLKLPYKQGGNQNSTEPSFSMYIYLPDAKDGLPALVERAGSESGFLDRYIPYQEINTRKFWIPKFKFEYKIELSDALKGLGLALPFDPYVGVREMVVCGPWPLYVSKIYHKAFIEVDECGTEAAAATVAVMQLGSCAFTTEEFGIDFIADHPFLYVIRENNTGIVQFIGQVLNPST